MVLEYFGHSCFRITTAKGTTVVTDPYTNVGYELPQDFCAYIVTVSHGHFDHNYVDGVQNIKEVWADKAVFAFGGVTARSLLSNHDEVNGSKRGKNLIFIIEADGLRICHLGDLGEAYTSLLGEQIGEIDILLLPIGGTYTIDAKQAKEYVDKLNPKLVVPMHYRPKDGTIDIQTADVFLSLFENVCYAQPKHILCMDSVAAQANGVRIIYMERENGCF